jgi:hypothetical protein
MSNVMISYITEIRFTFGKIGRTDGAYPTRVLLAGINPGANLSEMKKSNFQKKTAFKFAMLKGLSAIIYM